MTEDPNLPPSQLTKYIDWSAYAACAVLLAYAARRWPIGFGDIYSQSDDVRIYFFPMWAFHSDLFEGDYLAQAMRAYWPWLYQWLGYLTTLVMDVLVVPKFFQAAAILWGAFHAMRIGRRRCGGPGALLGLYLVLHCWAFLNRSAGGAPRAFAFPVLLMVADALDAKSPRLATAAPPIGLALYPPAGLIALITYLLDRSLEWLRVGKGDQRRRIFIFATVTVGLSFLALAPTFIRNLDYGTAYTYAQAEQMPEFGPKGRWQILPAANPFAEAFHDFRYIGRPSLDSPIHALENITQLGKVIPLDFIMLLALPLCLLRWSKPPRLSGMILLAGCVAYVLARFLAFRLHLPTRMLYYSIPAAGIVFFLEVFGRVQPPARPENFSRWFSLGLIAVLFAVQGISFSRPLGLVDGSKEIELFELLQELPPNALFSGHPKRMDNVPLWAKRRVLVNYETSQLGFDKTWEEMREHHLDNFAALYATDPAPLIQVRDKYGVDYFIIHDRDVGPNYARHARFFAPFDEALRDLTSGPAQELLWNSVPDEAVVGRASGFIVVDLDKFLKSLIL